MAGVYSPAPHSQGWGQLWGLVHVRDVLYVVSDIPLPRSLLLTFELILKETVSKYPCLTFREPVTDMSLPAWK